MGEQWTDEAQQVLERVTTGDPRAPGVSAGITDADSTLWEGAAGVRSLADGTPMTVDTVFAGFLTTKPITGTTCLQLVEEGRLDLDAPAKQYVAALGDVQVLEGFDASGPPVLRAPRRDITTRMLLLHTARFGYDFFSEPYLRLATGARSAQRHHRHARLAAHAAAVRPR